MSNKHTIDDLYQMQSLPLSAKIRMTEYRIKQWVDRFGEDGVYVSFSGGKDSTVLLDIARKIFPDIKAVFVDTGLEYPEIRQFVKGFDNVDWVRPKMTFKQVIEKYGYPFISKEVSECVFGARKFLRGGGTANFTGNCKESENIRKKPYQFECNKLCGHGKYVPIYAGGADNKYRKLRGLGEYQRTYAVEGGGSFGDSDKGQQDSGEYP